MATSPIRERIALSSSVVCTEGYKPLFEWEALEACEHTFVTAQPNANVRFRRAIEPEVWLAEDAARELPNLPLEDALQLVHLYFERGSPKAEPAAKGHGSSVI